MSATAFVLSGGGNLGQSRVDLRVIPPLCPLDVSPLDFSRTDELITRSHTFAAQWLSEHHEHEDQCELLSIHGHD